MGTKNVYLLSVGLGSLTAITAISLNYLPKTPFVIIAVICRLAAGFQETQFEVQAFVYFAEGVLKSTTKERQASAISTYKTVGALGFLLGAGLAPLALSLFGYDGTFALFLILYTTIGIICGFIYPQVNTQPALEAD